MKLDKRGDSRRRDPGKRDSRRDSRPQMRSPTKGPSKIIPKRQQPVRLRKDQKDKYAKILSDLVGTRAACIFDSREQLLGKVPVTELYNTLRTIDNPHTIIFDGKVDQRLNGVAMEKGVKYLIGMEKEEIHSPVAIVCKKDLE